MVLHILKKISHGTRDIPFFHLFCSCSDKNVYYFSSVVTVTLKIARFAGRTGIELFQPLRIELIDILQRSLYQPQESSWGSGFKIYPVHHGTCWFPGIFGPLCPMKCLATSASGTLVYPIPQVLIFNGFSYDFNAIVCSSHDHSPPEMPHLFGAMIPFGSRVSFTFFIRSRNPSSAYSFIAISVAFWGGLYKT